MFGFGWKNTFTIASPWRDWDSMCSTSLTSVVTPRSAPDVIRCSISSDGRPWKVNTRLMTGISISGKMSVGVRDSATGVSNRIASAITMKVYGRDRARRTNHIGAHERTGQPGPAQLRAVDRKHPGEY